MSINSVNHNGLGVTNNFEERVLERTIMDDTNHSYYVKFGYSLQCGLDAHSVKVYLNSMSKGSCDVYVNKEGVSDLDDIKVTEIADYLIDNAKGHSALLTLHPKVGVEVAKMMERKWALKGYNVKIHVYQPLNKWY